MQQGQVFELKKRAVDSSPVWAYRYRNDGPGSRRYSGEAPPPSVTRRKHSNGRSNISVDFARDGRERAIRLLDGYAEIEAADAQALDVQWTPQLPIVANRDNGNRA
jgi:hypothetical protein